MMFALGQNRRSRASRSLYDSPQQADILPSAVVFGFGPIPEATKVVVHYVLGDACEISQTITRPSAMPSAIARTTNSASAAESRSRSFHERAISRALERSLSVNGGGLIGIASSTPEDVQKPNQFHDLEPCVLVA